MKICKVPSRNETSLSLLEHIDHAVQWICRAQDAFPDGGVARSYELVYNGYFRRKGWIPSYPETTGYIIPTIFDVAQFKQSRNLQERAVRMAEWECDVQMENGAVMGGTVDQAPTPAIFNTGQVIFGLIRTYHETGREKFLQSAVQAGRYLIEQQADDGSWRKSLSNYASTQIQHFTYNTRTAWALAQLGHTTGQPVFSEACRRNIEFALLQQIDNGWFKNNCLNDPQRPLLHTIAYCIRGILESGLLLNDNHYIERARLAADVLCTKLRSDGSLPGRFDAQWRSAVDWSCLTGDAQTAIIWGRLYQIFKDDRYLSAMKQINRYLRRVQLLQTKNPNIIGGITGSQPLNGAYGEYAILNWAVKFFIDAMLLEGELVENWQLNRPNAALLS